MPADGWVARTYQSWLTEIDYRGKRLGYGLGMWLLTLHSLPDQPGVFWWTKVAHLSWIDPTIYYLQPTQDSDGDWHEPDVLYVPDRQLTQVFSYRKRGDLVATAGDTGIEWGYRDNFDPVTGQVAPRASLPSWDLDLHIHFEVYRRKNGSEVGFDAERICIDPFGLYGQVRADAPLYTTGALGPGHVFLINTDGQLLHATDLSK